MQGCKYSNYQHCSFRSLGRFFSNHFLKFRAYPRANCYSLRSQALTQFNKTSWRCRVFASRARQMCRIGGFMTGKRERVKEFGAAEGKKGDQELSWRGWWVKGERASERVAGAFTKRRVNFTSNIDAFHNEQPSPPWPISCCRYIRIATAG